MDLQPVTGTPFGVTCYKCGKHTQTDRELVYADLQGESWKAYYCNDCARSIVEGVI